MRAGHLSRFVGTIGGALVMVVVSTGTGLAQPETPADPSPSPTALVLQAGDLATSAAVVEVATSDATSVTLVADGEACVLGRASILESLSGHCSAIPHPTDAVVFEGGKLVLELDEGRGRLEMSVETKRATDVETLTVTATRFAKCTSEAKENQSCQMKWQAVESPPPESLEVRPGLEGGGLEADVYGRTLSITLERPQKATATLHEDGYLVLRRPLQVSGTYGRANVITARSKATLFERVEPVESSGPEAEEAESPDVRHWGSKLLGLYLLIVVVMFWISTNPPSEAALRARAAYLRTAVAVAAARFAEPDRPRLRAIADSIDDLLSEAIAHATKKTKNPFYEKRRRLRAAAITIDRAARLRLHLSSEKEVEVRLRSALAETHKLSPATKKAWASQSTALLADNADKAYRRAALIQLSAQLEATDDARADAISQLQNKTFMLTLTGIIATWVLVYNDYGLLLFSGAVGALIGRFIRVKTSGARTDSGLSWALVTASPIVGALFAWAGLVLMALGKRINIIDFGGITELELSTLRNPGGVILGLAVLFSISERLLDRVVSKSLAGIFPDSQDAAVDLSEKTVESGEAQGGPKATNTAPTTNEPGAGGEGEVVAPPEGEVAAALEGEVAAAPEGEPPNEDAPDAPDEPPVTSEEGGAAVTPPSTPLPPADPPADH